MTTKLDKNKKRIEKYNKRIEKYTQQIEKYSAAGASSRRSQGENMNIPLGALIGIICAIVVIIIILILVIIFKEKIIEMYNKRKNIKENNNN